MPSNGISYSKVCVWLSGRKDGGFYGCIQGYSMFKRYKCTSYSIVVVVVVMMMMMMITLIIIPSDVLEHKWRASLKLHYLLTLKLLKKKRGRVFKLCVYVGKGGFNAIVTTRPPQLFELKNKNKTSHSRYLNVFFVLF